MQFESLISQHRKERCIQDCRSAERQIKCLFWTWNVKFKTRTCWSHLGTSLETCNLRMTCKTVTLSHLWSTTVAAICLHPVHCCMFKVPSCTVYPAYLPALYTFLTFVLKLCISLHGTLHMIVVLFQLSSFQLHMFSEKLDKYSTTPGKNDFSEIF